ncbi:type II secretion system protein [Bdellovibrio sp. HCB290]|uniref:type II secretion system protein n=1 Tax=Bdellovibrio sp. HCB290 TaxID=3394356 RepID=UPI0039B41E2E
MFRRDRSISHKLVSGFSALEMMVAIGILATIFILAMPFFSQQGKIIKEMRTPASCQAVLDTAFSRINSLGNSLDSYPAKMNTSMAGMSGAGVVGQRAFLPPDLPADAYSFDPQFKVQRDKMFDLAPNRYLYSPNPGKTIKIPQTATTTKDVPIRSDGLTLYTPLLLKGSMEYLATKYNSGHCNAFSPVSLLTTVDSQALNSQFQGGLKNLNLALKVNRYDLASNSQNNGCDKYWPRPRNGGRTNVTYEPQFGYSAQTRQIIGIFPSWMSDKDGLRVTLRANFTNEKGQTETCEGTKDFSLPEDKQNVVDYFYDVNYVKTAASAPGAIIDNTNRTNGLRAGTKCSGTQANCLGHPFETILTNLQPYNASNPKWPENRDRPLCSQTPANYIDLVVTFRVYNMHKDGGVVPMCLDTSRQWFKNSPGNWCPGSYNGGAETSFDKSWDMRYTGWVPCEQMQFCNSRPDKVEVIKNSGTNFKFPGMNVQQPYVEYKYTYNQIRGDKANPRMWGCEMKFGIAMIDLAGNLSYVPAQEKMMDQAGIAGDRRPPVKEINPHVYFKPPPCYTCNCKPCKGGKGLFGGLFNWVLFAVLVIVTMGVGAVAWISITALTIAITTGVAAVICYNGGLGCASDGGRNYVPDSAGGKYRSCDDSNNGCKCGKKCNIIRPPSPGWSAPLDDAMDISQLEKNSCVPGNTFYVDNAAYGSLNGIKPQLGYKTSNGAGNGFTYNMDPNAKVTPGDELLYTVFDSKNKQFCYVAVRCSAGKFQVIKESSEVPNDNTLYPLMGCYPVKVAKKINFNSTKPGIAQGGNACLEVQFNKGPQNPQNNQLWKWSDFNEQCSVTNSSSAPSSDPRVVAGSCPVTSPIVPVGAQQVTTGSGCALPTADPNDLVGMNFACQHSKLSWDPCLNSNSKTGPTTCPKWCYADCKVPEYVPEHPWMDAPHNVQKYYENMGSGDAGLPFCTMDRKLFDAIL